MESLITINLLFRLVGRIIHMMHICFPNIYCLVLVLIFVPLTSFALKSKEKQAFVWFFSHLLDKIFTLEQTNSFVFFLLNQIFRTFDFVEDTFARQLKNKFTFILYFAHLFVLLSQI